MIDQNIVILIGFGNYRVVFAGFTASNNLDPRRISISLI